MDIYHKVNFIITRRLSKTKLSTLIKTVKTSPMDYSLHYALGKLYLRRGQYVQAIAQFRTSLLLGGDPDEIREELILAYKGGGFRYTDLFNNCEVENQPDIDQSKNTHDNLFTLSPPRYHRLRSIASFINAKEYENNPSILDIGGGDGALALFLPGKSYMLADPITNGLSGTTDVFPQKHFDIIVACHVLEHIPAGEKIGFLLNLSLLAKTAVILLGPLEDNESQESINDFFYDITKASWAKEHVDCSLPTLSLVKEFGEKYCDKYQILPNSDKATVYWMIFAEYFAKKSRKHDQFWAVSRFSNMNLDQDIRNEKSPNDFIVEFLIRE